MENPIETVCPICNHRQLVTSDNSEKVYDTVTYWCEKCGEQYIPGMRCYEYKYS